MKHQQQVSKFINGVSFEVVATVTDIAGNTATDISNFEITVDTTNPADAVVTNPVSTITVNKTTDSGLGRKPDLSSLKKYT